MDKVPQAVLAKAREVLQADILVDTLEPQYKRAVAHKEIARRELHDMLGNLGVRSLDIVGVGKVAQTVMTYARLKTTIADADTSDDSEAQEHVSTEESRAALYKWALDTPDESGQPLADVLFAFQPRFQRLNVFVRDCIEEGKELPPGIDLNIKKGIRLLREKK